MITVLIIFRLHDLKGLNIREKSFLRDASLLIFSLRLEQWIVHILIRLWRYIVVSVYAHHRAIL